MRIPEDALAAFRKSPALEPYLHYVDNVVRTRDHILSPEVEQILAGASLPGTAHQGAFSSLESSDIAWPSAAGWARITHFYTTFYVWPYATSYAGGRPSRDA